MPFYTQRKRKCSSFCCRISTSQKEDSVQAWEYIRLTVHFNNNGRIVAVFSNIGTIYSLHLPKDKRMKLGRRWLDDYFAELGDNGWELVSSLAKNNGSSEIHYFKRPLDEDDTE